MKQQDKELLLKDLCARLPYGVIVEHVSGIRGTLHDLFVTWFYGKNDEISKYEANTMFFGDVACDVTKFKPYLFPLSSMTEEQRKELFHLSGIDIIYGKFYTNNEFTLEETLSGINWLLKNHFDIYDLIPRGLAIDTTNKNIY